MISFVLAFYGTTLAKRAAPLLAASEAERLADEVERIQI
jgi:hypothetical protein